MSQGGREWQELFIKRIRKILFINTKGKVLWFTGNLHFTSLAGSKRRNRWEAGCRVPAGTGGGSFG